MGIADPLEGVVWRCFDGRVGNLGATTAVAVAFTQGEHVQRKQSRRTTPTVSCEECYFKRNLLCALELAEPCSTFRPYEAQLRPPDQLRLVFRQERRASTAWAFPSAQEQAALHAG